jgi:exoribonuclease R
MPFLRTKNYQTFEVVDESTYEIVHTFEGAGNAAKALPSDDVELDPSGSLVLKSRAPHPPLAGYLELNSKTTFGHTKSGLPLYLFAPLNPAYPSFIVGSKEKDRSQKRVAIIEFLEWTENLPRGSLKQLLGVAGTLEAEEEALLWNACPYKNLKDGLAILEDDCPSRTQLTGVTFNIDPEGCRDIDDCITMAGDAEGTALTITIADVASCVEEMGAVDLMAAQQGQTLYRDGMAIRPMLPPFYSEDQCSLVAGQTRRGVSLTFRFNQDLVLQGPITWSESLITNQTSYSYETFTTSEHAPLLGTLVSALENETIEDPSQDAQRHGSPPLKAVESDPHIWIQALMLRYNKEAAKRLLEAGVGILRTHEAPDLKRLEKYIAMDESLAKLAHSAASYTLIGSKPAYTHWGIGTEAYCHATSPIRRYADLANQRILKQLIRGNREGLFVSVPVSDLNQRFKISKGYERDRVLLQVLLGSGAREFDARILDLVETDDSLKISIWIEEWSQRVKYRVKTFEKTERGYRIGSVDETEVQEVAEGDQVRIRCGLNLGARRWKERLVLQILEYHSYP